MVQVHSMASSGIRCYLVRQSHLSCLLMIRREGNVVSLVTSGEAFVVEKMARKLQVAIPEVDVAGGAVKLCAQSA